MCEECEKERTQHSALQGFCVRDEGGGGGVVSEKCSHVENLKILKIFLHSFHH